MLGYFITASLSAILGFWAGIAAVILRQKHNDEDDLIFPNDYEHGTAEDHDIG
jgi:hypothetical protein